MRVDGNDAFIRIAHHPVFQKYFIDVFGGDQEHIKKVKLACKYLGKGYFKSPDDVLESLGKISFSRIVGVFDYIQEDLTKSSSHELVKIFLDRAGNITNIEEVSSQTGPQLHSKQEPK
ncbi:hypothetical protein WH50_11910 [Pokkaliibacter plantistimulans]|uniref:BTB domain-containing protein n=1 Tax=Pokkaliibacter plantistimulans TaxID=1635171 RepID=A0ABX5LXP0_9GAMM|nr:hypothetical protein WH50_11910 [Pokkaliibacter plantistimulans]